MYVMPVFTVWRFVCAAQYGNDELDVTITCMQGDFLNTCSSCIVSVYFYFQFILHYDEFKTCRVTSEVLTQQSSSMISPTTSHSTACTPGRWRWKRPPPSTPSHTFLRC